MDKTDKKPKTSKKPAKKEYKQVRGSGEFTSAKKEDVKKIKVYQKTKPSAYWWNEADDELHESVFQSVLTIESSQSILNNLRVIFARLYGNYEILGYPFQMLGGRNSANQNSSSNRIALNVIQSVIDTCAAKIAKDQPKMSFVTTGSNDYFLKLRAQKLTKYMSGLFKQAKVYDNAEAVFRDACIVGTGFLKIFEEDKEIKTEWCALGEIVVDELDGLYQDPKCIHQIRLVNRDALMSRFPDKIAEIGEAQSYMLGKMALSSTTDLIKVIESWHKSSAKGAKDGKHCISISSATLFAEDYEKDYFPIVPFRWMNKPLGYQGRGITEELLAIQTEINKLLTTIQRSIELAAVPMVFVPDGAKIASDHLLNNTIARMVTYSGPQPPTWLTPTAQNQEIYEHLKWFIEQAYQIVGVTQSSASGQKPAGVDSAVAIRTVTDIETSRFAMVALRWEKWFMDVAKIMVDMSKDLYTRNPNLKATYVEKKMLHEIKWKDVNLDCPFDVQCFPTSQLPDTPAGRIETISEYIQNQWISKERGMSLLNLDPDLEGEVNLQTSSLRLTEKWLSEMVEDGVYHHPEIYMNLPLALNVAQGIYTQLQVDACPEDRLELVRQFMNEIIDVQKQLQAEQQAAAQPPAPQGPPPGPQNGPPVGPAPGMNPAGQ
jgi:hypothetical protein